MGCFAVRGSLTYPRLGPDTRHEPAAVGHDRPFGTLPTGVTRPPFMRLATRVIAGVTSLLALQLSLLGTGTLCKTSDGHGASRRGHDHNVSVVHQPLADGAVMSHTPPDAAPSHCDATGDDDACGVPSTGRCASMISCSGTLSALSSSAPLVSISDVAEDPDDPVMAVVELTFAPELPPPRA
jgi:hypothetical protein